MFHITACVRTRVREAASAGNAALSWELSDDDAACGTIPASERARWWSCLSHLTAALALV